MANIAAFKSCSILLHINVGGTVVVFNSLSSHMSGILMDLDLKKIMSL